MTSSLEGNRVILVVAWAALGGAERNAFQVARHLAQEEGAQVEVVALTDEKGRFRDHIEALDIVWHPFPVHWVGGKLAKARALERLALRLRRLRPDVLLPYTTRPNVLCGLVWRATGAQLCIWTQKDLLTPSKFGPRLLARAARGSSLLFANSPPAAEFLVSSVGAPPGRVRVILDTVELPQPAATRAEWRGRLDLSDETIVTTMLAHFRPGKDYDTLLRAWRIIVDRLGDEAVLVLAGKSEGYEDTVKALAFDLDLGRSVRFLGDVEDVTGLLGASDVAALISLSESFPNSVLESMALGLPVLATDIDGIRPMLGAEQQALLTAPSDVEGLVASYGRLHADAALRRRLGDENKRLIAERKPAGPAAADEIRLALATLARKWRP